MLAFQDTLGFITPKQLEVLADKINTEIANLGQRLFTMSLASIPVLISALTYLVLVPLLFSEVTNIHPIAIIVSILLFGGLWGFWGVVFAIPLATLVNAILRAWPRTEIIEEEESILP